MNPKVSLYAVLTMLALVFTFGRQYIEVSGG